MRFNGWRRLGVVLAVTWLPIGFFWGNSVMIRQSDWAVTIFQTCLKLQSDWGPCSAQFAANWKAAMAYHWLGVALFVALPFLIFPLLWGLVRGLRRVTRWVRAGFAPPSP